jgi:AraC-like DNA-binding protein
MRGHLTSRTGDPWRQRGAALVEFSIALPFFLLLLSGFFDLYSYMTARAQTRAALRSVARYVSGLRADDDCRQLASDKLRCELGLLGLSGYLSDFEGVDSAAPAPDRSLILTVKLSAPCLMCRVYGAGARFNFTMQSVAVLENEQACRDDWLEPAAPG